MSRSRTMHGPAFYDLLTRLMPDWPLVRARLARVQS